VGARSGGVKQAPIGEAYGQAAAGLPEPAPAVGIEGNPKDETAGMRDDASGECEDEESEPLGASRVKLGRQCQGLHGAEYVVCDVTEAVPAALAPKRPQGGTAAPSSFLATSWTCGVPGNPYPMTDAFSKSGSR
jgi:hypothetical protein